MHRVKVDPGVSELPRGNELSRDHVNRPLVWLLLSLLLLCFHIQKQLILHALAINPSVLIELHMGISNMRHLIVGQVGITIITSITGGEESNPL